MKVHIIMRDIEKGSFSVMAAHFSSAGIYSIGDDISIRTWSQGKITSRLTEFLNFNGLP